MIVRVTITIGLWENAEELSERVAVGDEINFTPGEFLQRLVGPLLMPKIHSE